MTIDNIILGFELQVSDTTELSTSEEYIVANRVYNKICNDRPWEWLKTSISGTMSSDADGYFITPPTDFAFFSENFGYSQNNDATQNNTTPKVIFIGTNYTPYTIINFADRRQYRNYVGYAYFDVVSNKIRFTNTPTSTTYEFDYIKVPTALVTTSSPIFPARFHDIMIYGMAVDDQIIQLSPKATSYAAENQSKYQSLLDDLRYWNASLIQM